MVRSTAALWKVRFRGYCLALLCLIVFAPTGEAQNFSGAGDGSLASPYVITDVTQLQQMNLDLSAHYLLANDIDASETEAWNGGMGFEPIGGDQDSSDPGFQGDRFSGSLNGNGFRIHDLYIDRPSEEYVGLIGYADDAWIHGLVIRDASITGNEFLGSLVGVTLEGSLLNCSTSGEIRGASRVGGLIGVTYQGNSVSGCVSRCNVNGTGDQIGGLVGWNNNDGGGILQNCHANGVVRGSGDFVGGLIGTNGYYAGTGPAGIVQYCYAVGSVEGAGRHVGGLIGKNYTGVVSSYWDTETTGQDDSDGGMGKSTEEMFQRSTFFRWNSYTTWHFDESGAYPRLYWESDTPDPPSFTGEGLGTITSPYLIGDVTELQEVNGNLTAHYVLANDIDGTKSAWLNDGTGFYPIGGHGESFSGSFDGRGHTINGLNIAIPLMDEIGLFGLIDGATIQNVRLSGTFVNGRSGVGGLIGRCENSSILNACSDGEVSGLSTIGGLIGSCRSSNTISNSASSGLVYARLLLGGGLIGLNTGASVLNSYSECVISGTSYNGGLVGRNSGEVINCFSAGNVMAATKVGGLIGWDSDGTYTNSYWDVDRSGQPTSAGGLGKTTAEMFQMVTFEDWDFDAVWWIDEGNDYPRLPWELGDPKGLLRMIEDFRDGRRNGHSILNYSVNWKGNLNW